VDMRSIADPTLWLVELYTHSGSSQYGGERITQLEHALQCAWAAEQEGRPDALIVSALLHDVGHLLHKHGNDAANRGVDDHHETIGGNVLANWFPDHVTEPIRLHVSAKRYLCAVDNGYASGLSAASVRSLELQGGAFSASEARLFVNGRFATDAITLRRWDEAAKVQGAETPDLAHFLPLIRSHLK
jgi:[1-hydroxy-2-(trimethylamino)ethyl]phosphonate dioxygenase